MPKKIQARKKRSVSQNKVKIDDDDSTLKSASIGLWERYKSRALLAVVFALPVLSSRLVTNGHHTDSAQNDYAVSSCDYVMAPSSVAPNSGWGLYTLRQIQAGQAVLPGELAIPLFDVKRREAQGGMSRLLHDYAWASQVTGSTHEATNVHSILPGLGMLANGHLTHFNVIPDRPTVHPGSLTRQYSPGAGATTHYTNLTHFARHALAPGTELLVNYGRGWNDKIDDSTSNVPIPSRKELQQTGVCVDHLQPGTSTIPHAGRGAFAKRFLPKGSLVAPFPVVPLHRDNLHHKQLLWNYCLGHANSSLLLFSYAPMVQWINHHRTEPNVVLEWYQDEQPFSLSLEQAQRQSLTLVAKALRDIYEGEEVFMDYGEAWEAAWNRHVSTWKPPQNASNYHYAHAYNDQLQQDEIRTLVEHSDHPDNLQTSCYFELEANHEPIWKWSRTVWQLPNLHPCRILERQGRLYTVQIQDRTIANVPREAIQFTDRPYTTDLHLQNAFRHEMGIPAGLFPSHWMDRVHNQ